MIVSPEIFEPQNNFLSCFFLNFVLITELKMTLIFVLASILLYNQTYLDTLFE